MLGLLTPEDELESYRIADIDIMSFCIMSNNLPILKCYLKEKLESVSPCAKALRSKIVTNERDIETPFGGLDGFKVRTSTLMLAMAFASPETVKFLVKSGADPNVTGKRGADALDYACFFGRVDNILMWLEMFPKYFERCRPLSPLFTAVIVPGPLTINVLETLIAVGEDVSRTFQFGLTLLHALSIPGNIDSKLCTFVCRAVHARNPDLVNAKIVESKEYNRALIFALRSVSSLGNRLFMFPRLQSAFTLLYECLGKYHSLIITIAVQPTTLITCYSFTSCLLHIGHFFFIHCTQIP